MKRIFVLVLGAAALWADSAVTGPVIGFVLNQGSIRPILGIPGAARLGDPVVSGIATGAVSTSAETAVFCRDGVVDHLNLRTLERAGLAEFSLCPDSISVSPSGAAAVLIFSNERQVRVVKTDRSAERTLDLPEAPQQCAVSDGGGLVLCASGQSGIQAYSDDSGLYAIPTEDPVVAISFLQGSRHAVFATERQIHLLADGREPRLLASIDGITGVAVSGDNTRVVVSAKASIALITVADGSMVAVDAPAGPDRLHALSGAVFRITSGLNSPIWLMDISGHTPRLTFVPQPEASNE